MNTYMKIAAQFSELAELFEELAAIRGETIKKKEAGFFQKQWKKMNL